MREGNYKSKLIIPTIPSYKVDVIGAIGKFFCTKEYFRFDFTTTSNDVIARLNEKRKLSSYGREICRLTSEFFDKDINHEELIGSQTLLMDGVNKLKKYEGSERLLRGAHKLEGHANVRLLGGISRMKGEIYETKPSAYSSFKLHKDDRQEYLSLLERTLRNTYDYIKKGFKCEENDGQFQSMIKSLLFQEDDISLAQTKSINDYLREVLEDVSIAVKLYDFYWDKKLLKLHYLTDEEQFKVLKDAGFRPMGSINERFSSSVKYPVISTVGFVASIATILGGASNGSYLLGGVGVSGLAASAKIFSLCDDSAVMADYIALKKIKSHYDKE